MNQDRSEKTQLFITSASGANPIPIGEVDDFQMGPKTWEITPGLTYENGRLVEVVDGVTHVCEHTRRGRFDAPDITEELLWPSRWATSPSAGQPRPAITRA